ncbi:diacylglycerol kinase family lipid kinase [Runella sp. CRIBMP]|uniref:diacylglycerol/lipid kinase family protein n=1 Tax=Runella sp. CRIBMP TaxID=2683261 RepID=UPI0014130797|nr:diacylglycerol kinase family protein [Runella sp. CRIBMP]NBB20405.1 diacylglycerol kinase family lipid kinase [Runella sp. CRIBMP]
MSTPENYKIFFILNPGSGRNTRDWAQEITNYFAPLNHTIELYKLPKSANVAKIKDKIEQFSPHRVVAVGGDGTIKLAAECILHTNISLGILPAGSANGLAYELGITDNPAQALDVLITGITKTIHTTVINGELCLHLSDIGLNAYAMKKFKIQKVRGMWGYLIASLKVLWQNPMMEVELQIDQKAIKMKAAMIVIANATKYGTGALINPVGTLEDELFEVVVIKKLAVRELFKMVFFHASYNSETVEIFQTDALRMKSTKKVHFQIDGEYLGKVNEVKAILIPNAFKMIVPPPAVV